MLRVLSTVHHHPRLSILTMERQRDSNFSELNDVVALDYCRAVNFILDELGNVLGETQNSQDGAHVDDCEVCQSEVGGRE